MAIYPGVGTPTFVRSTPRRRRPLPILDSYIIREMLPPFALAFSVFLLFWFVNIFFVAADYIVNKGAPVFVVLRFLLFRVPQATPMAFPFAALFATLMAFGRLMADNEITALRTSGVSFLRIARTPIIAGLLVFGLSYAVNEKIVPQSTELSTRTFYQILYKSATLPIPEGIYRGDPLTGDTFYIQRVEPDHRTMENVMIFRPARTTPFVEITAAKTAILNGTTLTLQHATINHFNSSGEVTFSANDKTVEVGLPLAESSENFLSSAGNDPYTMDSATLARDIKYRKQTGQGGSDLAVREITLANKLAYPFASFIAVMIALPLAVRFGKQGRALGMAMSIVMMFVYWAVGAMAGAFGKNLIDPYLAAWIPNILMTAAGGYLILSEDR